MDITNSEELMNLENNKFFGSPPNLINSSISFHGENNIIACEDGVTLKDSNIIFHSDNSVLYLSSNNHDYLVNISINRDSVCFIGKNNYFNGLATFVVSEAKNIMIGEDCLFSYDVVFRVADAHLIYSSTTKKRLNNSKSIYVGDHVWFGQGAMIFKGTQIGSGSIIGAGSILSNKVVPSNVTFAGSPARPVKEDTFWTSHSTHGWGEKETGKMNMYSSEEFVYKNDESTIGFNDIEENIDEFSSAEDTLKYIGDALTKTSKNRFYIAPKRNIGNTLKRIINH
ncbi:acyltransferase [Methanobrevibacter sp.]|uniref:acyltransferase n=1 Tax=Methanobrevibacter sp. TaxID=66852 RepID=UPI00388FEE33